VNIKFIPSRFYFVCCKAFRVLIKTKWKVFFSDFKTTNSFRLTVHMHGLIYSGVIAVRWRDDN